MRNIFNYKTEVLSIVTPIVVEYTNELYPWTFPSSGILDIRKHDVSETGSVSVLR
jgi:hypothetical protein